MNRKDLWESEYSYRQNLPSTRTEFPSRALANFLENPPHNLEKHLALDLGFGNGRNTIHLLKNGFEHVHGVEFSETAVKQARKKVEAEGLTERTTLINETLGKPIDLSDESVNLATDMMVMHAMTDEDRRSMFGELIRVLSPGGYFLFNTMGIGDYEEKLLKEQPGDEENSYQFEVEGDIVQERLFYEEELVGLLKPLEKVFIERQEVDTSAFDGVYHRVYLTGLFQKPYE